MKNFSAPRGTFDILPPDSKRWQALERRIDDVCSRFGYGEIRTPIFESTDVFVRTLGETTDVVDKEMYTFVDRGGRSITLRPELTAPAVRAVLEHDLLRTPPVKLYYRGAFFRYERPQKGRFRQAHQFGVECFGVEGPEADAEVIVLALEVIRRSGISEVTLEVNSMGCATCRADYRAALVAYLDAHRDALSETSQQRLARNPLRILDSKDEGDKRINAEAPNFADYLTPEAKDFFAEVCAGLTTLGIKYMLNPRLVRGLDYYCHTAFEFITTSLGAQGTVLGGGRYDGLMGVMGGPETPGVGWAAGIERLALLIEEPPAPPRAIALVPLGKPAELLALQLAQSLRRAGFHIELGYSGNLSRRLQRANKIKARAAVILGENEIAKQVATVRDLDSGEQAEIPLASLTEWLAAFR